VNIMRGRFDQLLLTGVLRNMGDGACGQRQVASGVIRLSGLRIWRTVCRPRPYDAAEHGGAQSLRLPTHKRLPTHLVF
jgi:hypothetical protein